MHALILKKLQGSSCLSYIDVSEKSEDGEEKCLMKMCKGCSSHIRFTQDKISPGRFLLGHCDAQVKAVRMIKQQG